MKIKTVALGGTLLLVGFMVVACGPQGTETEIETPAGETEIEQPAESPIDSPAVTPETSPTAPASPTAP